MGVEIIITLKFKETQMLTIRKYKKELGICHIFKDTFQWLVNLDEKKNLSLTVFYYSNPVVYLAKQQIRQGDGVAGHALTIQHIPRVRPQLRTMKAMKYGVKKAGHVISNNPSYYFPCT